MIDPTLSLFAGHGSDDDAGSDNADNAEHAAFVNALYERHRPALLRYLLGLLRRRPDAEDVLQETYARLLAGVPLDRDEAELLSSLVYGPRVRRLSC